MAAPKKTQTNYGDFTFDTDLDFNFDGDAIPDERPKRDRKPVEQMYEGVKAGLRNNFSDPNTYKNIARDALPEGLGKTWDAVDDIRYDTGRLYDEALGEAKPQVAAIARKLERITPDSATKTKKFMRDLADKMSPTRQYEWDQEDRESEGVSRLMAETFGAMEQQRQRDREEDEAKDILGDVMEKKRNDKNFKVFQTISSGISGVNDYLNNFQLKYQKKSLELQFRSYFTLASMAKGAAESDKMMIGLMQATVKNTGLPEYAKIKEGERFKQIAKEQIFGSVQDNLFGTKDRVAAISERIRKSVKSQVQDFREALSTMDEMLEAGIGQYEMDKDMAEITGEKASGYKSFGQMLGNNLSKRIQETISNKARGAIEKNPTAMKTSYEAGQYANAPGALHSNVTRAEWFQDLSNKGMGGDLLSRLIGGGLRFLKDDAPDWKVQNTGIGREGSDAYYTGVRQTRAQVDEVPGLLARILREVTIMRTGDTSVGLLKFDPKTGKFATETKIAGDIIKSIKRDSAKGGYAREVDAAYEQFSGAEGKGVNASDEMELKKFVAKLSRKQNFVFEPNAIKRSQEYADLPDHLRTKAARMIRMNLGDDSMESAQNKYSLSMKAKRVQNEIKDPRSRISQAIADGNAEELVRMGLIVQDEDGNYDIKEDEFYKLIDGGIMATSDITMKENIQHYKPDPKKSLMGVQNTPISSWNYRQGAGLGNQGHIGPMAQDVRRNFGDRAAPGGKQLDLVSMNGHTMAAVQALAEKVDGINMSDSNSILQSIDKNIKAILDNGGIGGGGGISGGMGMGGGSKGFLSIMSDLFGYGSDRLGKGVDSAMSIGRGINDKVIKPGASALGSFVEKNKDEFKYQSVNLIRNAFEATANAVRFSSDMLFKGVGLAKGVGSSVAGFLKEKATNLFKKVSDVYVAGRDSPALSAALLEMGVYRDQVTNKVLRTMDDVAKIKNNIVDSAGNVVLSIQDRAKGLFDNRGKPIKSLMSDVGNFMMGRLSKGLGKAWDTSKDLFGMIRGRTAGPMGSISGKIRGMFNRGSEAGDAFKEKIAAALGSMKEGASGLFGSGSECSCWAKPLLVLEQIRDLLAIGKNSKRVKGIMDRKAVMLTPDDLKEDNRDAMQSTLLEQIRDASLVDKATATIDGILNTANAKLPGLSFRKDAAKRLRELKKGAVEKLSSLGSMFSGGGSPDFMGPLQPSGLTAQASPFGGGSLGGTFRSLGGAAAAGLGGLQKGLGGLMGRFNKSRFGGAAKGGIFGRLGGLAGRGMGFLGKGLGGLASMAGGLFGGNSEDKPDFVGPKQQAETGMTSGEYGSGLLSKAKERALKMFKSGKGGAFNDRDGDGDRDGGAADRKAQLEDIRESNEQRKQQAIAASKSGIESNKYMGGSLGGILKAAMGLFSGLAGGVGTIFSMAKGVLGGAASLLGGGGKGLFKGLGRAGGAMKGLGKAGGALGRGAMAAGRGALGLGRAALGLGGFAAGASKGIGTAAIGAAKGAGGLLSRLPGVASVASKVGSFAMSAVRIGAVAGLATGGTMGTIAGIASTAAAGLMAALSSPVIVGAAVVAGVGTAGYFGYKYLTRNRIDDWQRIRVIQYGLDGTSATESYNNQVIALEKYLEDGNIGYQGRRPYLNEKRIKPEEILGIFSIDPKDDERVSRLSTWFAERFKPVYLHHLAVLANIDMKAKLSELDKLPDDQKLEYLSKAGFESGPYNVTTSPFKGLDVLGTSIQPALDIVNAKIKTLGKAQQGKVKEALKNGEGKPTGEDAKNAKSVITSATNDHTAVAKAMPAPVADKYKLPEQLKNTASGVMEDSPAAGAITMDKTSDEAGGAGSSGGSKNLATASGPILDGTGGMKFVKLGKDAVLEGMQPRLLKHFLAMAQEYGEATGKTIQVNEAFRSFQRQEQLYRTHKGKAARPGTSMHEHGLAMDIQTEQLNELEKLGLLRKYGFTRPVGGETWHMEPAGIQGSEQLAKKDKSFADMAIGSSLGRGGGGIGSVKGSALGKRDQKLARELYNAGTGQKVNLDELSEKNPTADLKAPSVDAGGTKSASSALDSKGDKIAAQAGGRSPITQGGSVGFSASASRTASGGSEFETRPPSENTGKKGEGKGDIKSQIASAAQEAGGKPNELQLLSAMESGLKPNAKAGNAEGLNQFMPGAWGDTTKRAGGKYGIKPSDSRFDIRANTIMGEEYMKDNAKIISSVRPNPNFTDKYMAHYLGPYGAKKFFAADPDSPAWKINPKAANDPINKNLFFEGGQPLSVEGMYGKIEGRIDAKAKAFGIPYSPEGLKGKMAKDSPLQAEKSKEVTPSVSSAESFASAPTSAKVYSKETTSGGGSTTRYAAGPNGEPAKSVYTPAQEEDIKLPVTSRQRNAPVEAVATGINEETLNKLASSASAQVAGLHAIDRTLIEKVVPILSKMSDSLTKMSGGEGDESKASKPSAEEPVTYHADAFGAPVRNAPATPNSLNYTRGSDW